MTQNVEMMLCFLMWPKLCKKRASTLKYFSWGKWLVTSWQNLSIYLPLKSFLPSLLPLGNCKTPFSYQMAPYAKTDTIFAYCVLQVGIYNARAAQNWSQKSIRRILDIFDFLTFILSIVDEIEFIVHYMAKILKKSENAVTFCIKNDWRRVRRICP